MIGYYVHHQGSGHLHRCASIAARLDTEVTVLSSLEKPGGWTSPWVSLARDDDVCDRDEADLTAHGVLHWVPQHGDGLRRRARQILDWVDDTRPSLVVVDVSVEVTLLLRLAGVPVVVMGMPGERGDVPHVLGHGAADRIVAPWPAGAANGWSTAWRSKTHHVGAISRFDGRPRERPTGTHGCRGVLLGGAGGSTLTDANVESLHAATPGWTWTEAVGGRIGDDALWSALCRADVVVTHAGQNAVADVAAARVPAVVVAEPRPFGEQRGTVRALSSWGIGVTRGSWPSPGEWAALLDEAHEVGGDCWLRWSTGQGATDAARVLQDAGAE